MAKEPIQYIINNIDTIYKAYIENDRKPKATYESLKAGVISDIETRIEFKTFNSRIKPIMETYEFLQSDKPDNGVNQVYDIENLQSALNTVKRENENLYNENDRLKAESEKINREKVNLTQERKRLNSVIARLSEDLQHESEKVNQDKPIEVNQGNAIESKEDNPMINEMLQRIEQLEKAVFQNQDKPKEINQSKPYQDGNLFNKPHNVNPDKVKIGKWNITRRGNTYRAYRNFGDKGDIKGVKAVYIGKNLDKAEDKITSKGYPIE